MIQAIETHYKGYRFRSRLEARWAVFFDALDVEYRYEYQGYELPLDNGRYLPDFWLPSLSIFVEIKGNAPTDGELGKALVLSQATGHSVVVASNDCWYDAPIYLFHFNGDVPSGKGEMFTGYGARWGVCTSCYWPAIRNRVKKESFVYCFNPKCRYALAKGSNRKGFGMFRERDFPEIQDGWIAISDKSLEYIKQQRALLDAFAAARSARFEYGETPKVPRGKVR